MEEAAATVQHLCKASSDVTAALFAFEFIKESKRRGPVLLDAKALLFLRTTGTLDEYAAERGWR